MTLFYMLNCTVQLSIGFQSTHMWLQFIPLAILSILKSPWIHHAIPRHLLHIAGLTKVLDQLVVLEPICNVSIIGQFVELRICIWSLANILAQHAITCHHYLPGIKCIATICFSLSSASKQDTQTTALTKYTCRIEYLELPLIWTIFPMKILHFASFISPAARLERSTALKLTWSSGFLEGKEPKSVLSIKSHLRLHCYTNKSKLKDSNSRVFSMEVMMPLGRWLEYLNCAGISWTCQTKRESLFIALPRPVQYPNPTSFEAIVSPAELRSSASNSLACNKVDRKGYSNPATNGITFLCEAPFCTIYRI